jgi:hypothetical protein
MCPSGYHVYLHYMSGCWLFENILCNFFNCVFLDPAILNRIHSGFRRDHWDKDCRVCVGYNRALATVHRPPPPHAHRMQLQPLPLMSFHSLHVQSKVQSKNIPCTSYFIPWQAHPPDMAIKCHIIRQTSRCKSELRVLVRPSLVWFIWSSNRKYKVWMLPNCMEVLTLITPSSDINQTHGLLENDAMSFGR